MSISYFKTVIAVLFVLLFFCSCFFIPILVNEDSNFDLNFLTTPGTSYSFDPSHFIWPTPGYTTITSQFGYRKAPTSGASTYHSGIDIAAPTGSNIISTFSGKVTYTNFYGAGGFTVIIENGEYTAMYCHVSPDFLVHKGQYITRGQVIAKVGPKNVYGVLNNPYKDSTGKPTNGATTRSPFTFHNKKGRQSRQSTRFYLKHLLLHIIFIIIFFFCFSMTTMTVISTIT